jgi:hypothetical protein
MVSTQAVLQGFSVAVDELLAWVSQDIKCKVRDEDMIAQALRLTDRIPEHP